MAAAAGAPLPAAGGRAVGADGAAVAGGPAASPGWLDGMAGAVTFLTRVPVGGTRAGRADVGRGAVWFPVVGAAVGGIAALAGWGASLVLPLPVAALAAVATGAMLTGAIHLDGLADTADGYGAATRERALEIMRDHTVGTYGVVALVLALGLRAALVAALLTRPWALAWLVAAGALSRAAALNLGALQPAARAVAGASAAGPSAIAAPARPRSMARLLDGVGPRRAAVAGGLGLAIAALVGGRRGLLAAAVVAVGSAVWGWRCRRRLGGVTGDTLGAASEVAELAVLMVALAAPR